MEKLNNARVMAIKITPAELDDDDMVSAANPCRTVLRVIFLRNQQHDHGSAAADHNGINENSKSLDRTFVLEGSFLPAAAAAAGSGTGGFIGEQTP